MNTHFIKKYIFAVLFIVVLFTYSAFNLINEFPLLKQNISEFSFANAAEIRASVAKLEATINENVYEKYSFIEGYGLVQRILGTNVENGFSYVKDENGALTYTDIKPDINTLFDNVNYVKKIVNWSNESGAVPIVFLGADYYLANQNEYEKGIPYADYNYSLDYLSESMSSIDVPVFDYRDYIQNIYSTEDETTIYNTDHHWRTRTCFDLYSEFVDFMSDNYGVDFNDNEFDLTDENNFNFVHYDDYFLGSEGRETGINYSGLDDFELFIPKFETDFTYSFKTNSAAEAQEYSGTFEKTLIRAGNMDDNLEIYVSDRYSSFLNGVDYSDRIINNKNSDAPKVLAIRDSYFAPFALLLANSCSELDMVWSIKYEGNYEELIKNGNYDYVIIESGTGNLTSGMFFEKMKMIPRGE